MSEQEIINQGIDPELDLGIDPELNQITDVGNGDPAGEVSNEANALEPEPPLDAEFDEYGNVIEYEDTPAEQNAGSEPAQNADTQRLTNVETQLGQLAQSLQQMTGMMQQQRQQPQQQAQPQQGPQMEPDIDSMTPREAHDYAMQKSYAMTHNMIAQRENAIAGHLNMNNAIVQLMIDRQPDKEIVGKAILRSQKTGMKLAEALETETGLAAIGKNKQLTTKVNQSQRTTRRRRSKAKGGQRRTAPQARVTTGTTLQEDIEALANEQVAKSQKQQRRR